MNIEEFIARLAQQRFADVFNPYADVCPVHDSPGSPTIRRTNLEALLKALPVNLQSMWVGRDLGYRGARRTGIPLTDEVHISNFASQYNRGEVRKATKTQPVAERTAAEIWNVIGTLSEPPLLWNVFPFHPYERDNPFSNRTHTSFERNSCRIFLENLIEIFKPERIVAIGNDAFAALTAMGYQPIYVRHPSYGGQTEFRKNMTKLYPASFRRQGHLAV